ncbi:hypothetical protein [Pontibacter rugosus]
MFPSFMIFCDLVITLSMLYSGAYFLLPIIGIIMFVHFYVGRIPKYYKVKEIYMAEDGKSIVVKDLDNNQEMIIQLGDITKANISFGVLKLDTLDKGDIYTLLRSKELIGCLEPING